VAAIEDFRSVRLARGGKQRAAGSRWASPDKGHRGEIVAFIGAIHCGLPCPIPFQESVLSTSVTMDILESIRTRRSVMISTSG